MTYDSDRDSDGDSRDRNSDSKDRGNASESDRDYHFKEIKLPKKISSPWILPLSYTLLCWPKATFTFKSQTLVIAKTKIIKISVMLTEFKKFKLVL